MTMFPNLRRYYAQYYCHTLKIVSRLPRSSQQLFVPGINRSSGYTVSSSVADLKSSNVDYSRA